MNYLLLVILVNCINPMDGLYIYYVPDYFKISFIEIGLINIDSAEETGTLYTHSGELITETKIKNQGSDTILAEDLRMVFSKTSDLIIQMEITDLPKSRPIYYHRLKRPKVIDPLPAFPEQVQLKIIDGYYFLVKVEKEFTTLLPVTTINAKSIEFWDLPARQIKSLDL
jgi:hypothetical protein